MGFGNWMKDGVLNWIRGTAMPAPGTHHYLALHSADAGPQDDATELAIGVNGYARIAIPATATEWSAPTTVGGRRVITNVNTLVGATVSGALNGGVAVQYVTLRTTSTGGSQIANGILGTPKVITAGETLTFPPGTIQLLL